MASNYTNYGAERRKANPGVNLTQRSWSNYEGDSPYRSWVGTDMYRDSSYGEGGSRSALENSKSEMDRMQEEMLKDAKEKAKKKDRGAAAMLPEGYTLDDKGRVKNTAGYLQDEKYYTTDQKTGLKRMKTSSEMGMYDGGTAY